LRLPLLNEIQDKRDVPLHRGVGRLGIMFFDGRKDLGMLPADHIQVGMVRMVMPAIHLSRQDVADLFTKVTGKTQEPDIGTLVKVARQELRKAFLTADMKISGANFAIAAAIPLFILLYMLGIHRSKGALCGVLRHPGRSIAIHHRLGHAGGPGRVRDALRGGLRDLSHRLDRGDRHLGVQHDGGMRRL